MNKFIGKIHPVFTMTAIFVLFVVIDIYTSGGYPFWSMGIGLPIYLLAVVYFLIQKIKINENELPKWVIKNWVYFIILLVVGGFFIIYFVNHA